MAQEQQTPEEPITLAKEDFDEAHWQDVIAEITPKDCHHYYRPLLQESGEAHRRGDERAAHVFRLLGTLAALHLEAGAYEHPFANRDILDGVDIPYDLLAEVAAGVTDPELRARISDFLWVERRLFPMGQLAIRSYLEAAQNLEDTVRWVPFYVRIERAVELWATLGGPRNPNLPDVISYIERKLDTYNGEDPEILSAKLMQLLQERQTGDSIKYAALAEKAATNDPANKCACQKPVRARAYWEVKARWHHIEQDETAQRDAAIRAAETYVEEAQGELVCRPESYARATWHLQRAIAAYQQIADTSKRRNEIHSLMLEYQRQDLANYTPGPGQSIDLSSFVHEAREAIRGKTLEEALLQLALLGRPPSTAELRQHVEEIARSNSLHYAIPLYKRNEEGKGVGWRESLYFGTPEEQETAMRFEMYRQATVYQDAFAQGVVHTALQQINIEHTVRVGHFNRLVTNNPFIHPGREYIYARGLHAGVTGDFLTAAHLLVPQIEQSLRYLLRQHGVRVTGLDAQGVQDEHLLGSLLERPELIEILGEDAVFDLQGLLNERLGSNLRNLIAHGLMNTPSFFTNRVVYLWWLTLHLCCMPIGSLTVEPENGEAEQPHAEPTDQSKEADPAEGAGD